MKNMVFDACNGDPFVQEPRFTPVGKTDPLLATRQKQDDVKANSSEDNAQKPLGDTQTLEDAPAGGGDAAISTASLDSASTATGNGSSKPGWKFYNKMTTTDKDKIKKVRDYVSRFTESNDDVEETIEEEE